jgi:DNA-binding IclR family transcriptional regulator
MSFSSERGGYFAPESPPSKIARPVLEQLWKISDVTVNLAVLDGSSVLYLDVLESQHTFRLVSQIDMRRELHKKPE